MTANDRLTALSLVLSGALACAGLFWLSVGAPLADWRKDALAKRERTQSEIQRLTRVHETLLAERAQMAQSGELDLLWPAKESGAAMASVQSEINRFARENGITLRSIAPGRKTGTTGNHIATRIEFEATLDQLAGFLRDMETHVPALLVNDATLRRLTKPGAQQVLPAVFGQIDLAAPLPPTRAEEDG